MIGARKWQMAFTMGILGYLVWGIGYFALPVFYLPLRNEFGWSRLAVTSVGTLTIHALFIGVLLTMGAGNGILQHMPLYIRSLGYDVQLGGIVLGVLMAANLFGRVIVSAIAGRLGLGAASAISLASLAVAAAMFVVLSSVPFLLLGAVLAGLGYGGCIVTISAISGSAFPVKSIGGLMGSGRPRGLRWPDKIREIFGRSARHFEGL